MLQSLSEDHKCLCVEAWQYSPNNYLSRRSLPCSCDKESVCITTRATLNIAIPDKTHPRMFIFAAIPQVPPQGTSYHNMVHKLHKTPSLKSEKETVSKRHQSLAVQLFTWYCIHIHVLNVCLIVCFLKYVWFVWAFLIRAQVNTCVVWLSFHRTLNINNHPCTIWGFILRPFSLTAFMQCIVFPLNYSLVTYKAPLS